MLLRRSRLRLGGFYALRQSRSKPVKQDMNTPRELAGTFWLEVAWWRVFRFFGDGQGSKRERNSQLQRLRSRPFSTRFGSFLDER